MADPTPITRERIAELRALLADPEPMGAIMSERAFDVTCALIDAVPGLLDLAASTLSHPAALERAREEERARCAAAVEASGEYDPDWFGDEQSAYDKGSGDALAAIRALGPSPEAAATPSAANFEMPTTYRSVPTVTTGGTMPPSPPAMPADLRERVRKVLTWMARHAGDYASKPPTHIPNEGLISVGQMREAATLLAELEESKPAPEPPLDWQPIETVPTDRSKIEVRGGLYGAATLWANPEATSHLKKIATEWRPWRKPAGESQP